MNLIQKAKELITSNEVQDFCVDVVSDCVAFMQGDITAGARIIYTLTKGGFQLREQLFWGKFERFLSEVDVSEDFLANFCKVMADNDEDYDHCARVLDTVDKIDTLKKAKYLANASRCVASGFIDIATYFRICHILKNCLQEDLSFIINEVLIDGDYEYSDTIQGLMNCGLMYQSMIDTNENGTDEYRFTPFAKVMDIIALSYDNVARYPDPVKCYQAIQTTKKSTEISNVVLLDTAE